MTEPRPSRLNRFAHQLVEYRLPLALLGIALTALAWPVASRLSFDQSIESLYATDDPYLLDYVTSKQTFGGDEFVMVAYRDDELESPEGLSRLREFAKELSQIPGVQESSTQNYADALAPPELPFLLRLLLRTKAEKVRELVEGVLIGEDGKTTAIVLRLAPEADSPVSRGETFATIRSQASVFELPTFVVGEPVQVHDMFRYVEEDGTHLFRVSLSLLAFVTYVLFRSLRWVVLTVMVVLSTIVWTEATLVLSQMQLSMVSSMLNSLVTIIGIATVMHVTVHYRELRRTRDRLASITLTIEELTPAVFWTCATTAAGFAALLSSEITPVRSFGIMMALAALVVLAATSSFVPTGILVGRIKQEPKGALGEARLNRMLSHVSNWVERRPHWFVGGAFALALFSAAGFSRLEVETDFSKNFRENSPIVQSLNFVEEHLGGAGTFEVNFPAPPELTAEYLDTVRRLAADLRNMSDEQGNRRLTKVIAISDTLDLVPSLLGRSSIRSKLDQVNDMQPEFETSLYNAEVGRMRIVLRARERQASESKLEVMRSVRELGERSFSDVKVTGLFVLLAHLIESLLRDQLVSFGLAAVGIGSMVTIAFHSWRIGLICLIPNLFPIVFVIGAMGWCGLPVNIGTAMIASVSMGLTVDASIHYIAGYRQARARGLSTADSLRATHEAVGRALVFATLSLVIGFSVLTLSHFIPLIYFGALVSLAMLGGLLGHLLLLPILLKWIDR